MCQLSFTGCVNGRMRSSPCQGFVFVNEYDSGNQLMDQSMFSRGRGDPAHGNRISLILRPIGRFHETAGG